MIELSITIKDEEETLTQKFLLYDPITLSIEDKSLVDMVKGVQGKFKGNLEASDITVKTRMAW